MPQKLNFTNDYSTGAQPQILTRLLDSNNQQFTGYGEDEICTHARNAIRAACNNPEADVYFLVGGTQTNDTVIDAIIERYEGVLACDTGHVATHEAGAIESSGHKVLTIPAQDGKLAPAAVERWLEAFYADTNHDHEVQPGCVYVSQPSEYGTLYSEAELEALRKVCDDYSLPLFVDGARLAYALASPECDVDLPRLAELADVFYIGGTKCGALLGEAVVFSQMRAPKHFITHVKQHGALMAKGWVLGVQFDELMKDDLYIAGGKAGLAAAQRIRDALVELGYKLYLPNPTNQIFIAVDDALYHKLAAKVDMGFMERLPDGCAVVRICTSWATTPEQVDALIGILREVAGQ